MTPMLANPYSEQDPTNYWISEKLDGVRAIWDGTNFVSRGGNTFPAPQWFRDLMPAFTLDGELWTGRKRFQEVADIMKRKTPLDSDWKKVKFRVFDAPLITGGFEARLECVKMNLPMNDHINFVQHLQCKSRQHLEDCYQFLLGKGAEGVMLRAPDSPYVEGKSSLLLKYKPIDTDEGVLISTEPSEKLNGAVGALVLAWRALTIRIASGITDAMRQSPPPVGSSITFEYRGVTEHGQPRHATFIAVRNYE